MLLEKRLKVNENGFMPEISNTSSSQIANLSKKELEKLVTKAAVKDKSFDDYLLVNYFEKEYGEQDLFETTKADLDNLFLKRYKGYSQEQQTAGLLAACSKRIAEFSKVCKNKNPEVDLNYVYSPNSIFNVCK